MKLKFMSSSKDEFTLPQQNWAKNISSHVGVEPSSYVKHSCYSCCPKNFFIAAGHVTADASENVLYNAVVFPADEVFKNLLI